MTKIIIDKQLNW